MRPQKVGPSIFLTFSLDPMLGRAFMVCTLDRFRIMTLETTIGKQW